ncbi:unnamed protein product [Camellia sinensis]
MGKARREREREKSVLADMSVVAGAGLGLISLTNADMDVSVCERNGFWVQNCCHNSSLSSGFGFGFSIPPRPTFGVTLATKKLKQSWIFGLRTPSSSGRSIHVLLKAESTNRSVDGEIIKKELEFKPSFEDYLKAMESVRTGRDNKQTHNSIKRYKPTNADSSKLGDFQGHTQEEHASGQIDCKERGIRKLKDANLTIGFEEKGNAGRVRDELDGRESKIDLNIDNKLDMDEKKWRSEKKRTNSISVQQRQKNSGVEGHRFKADKASLKGTKMGIGVERNCIQVEAVPHERISVNNVKFTRRNKPIAEKSNDEQVELERAAFKSLEEFNDIVDKPRLSRNEMEERIQKLARWNLRVSQSLAHGEVVSFNSLNGADIDMPEWMFSKMMRSAKIRFSDHSMLRIIQILGKLGNWRRVLQLIEWLQLRDRFKSHKLRYIYTAALDALGKAKRPVEALNLFHAMQQHMSTYPDLVAYHFIAVTLGQAGHMRELFEVIDSMRSPPNKKFRTGVLDKWDPRLEPDIVVYNAVLNACVRRKQWEGAFWVLQQLKEQGQRPSNVTYGLVMEVMLACGKYNLVHDFFKKVLKSSIPNALTYKVLVNALWREGKTDEAVLAVEDMERRGIVGSAALYYDLARCLCSAGRCQEGLTQIDKICKVANKPLVVTYTGLVQACLEAGNIQNGSYIFNHMHKFCSPNLVTCNIMLKSYLEHGMFEEAKGLFQEMLEHGNRVSNKVDYKERVIPDIYTFNTMLDACVMEQRWDDFEFVYKQMLHYGYHFNAKRHLRMVMDACRAGKGGAAGNDMEALSQGRSDSATTSDERNVLHEIGARLMSRSGDSSQQLIYSVALALALAISTLLRPISTTALSYPPAILPPLSSSPPPPPPTAALEEQLLKKIMNALIGAGGDFRGWAGLLSVATAAGLSVLPFPVDGTLFIPGDDALSHLPTATLEFDPFMIPYHIVPQQRLSFSDLQLFSTNTRLPTLLPSNSILITNNSRSNFTIDGAPITHPDLYLNSDIAVHGIKTILDYSIYGSAIGIGSFPPPAPQAGEEEVVICGGGRRRSDAAASCEFGFQIIFLVVLFVLLFF